MHIDQRKEQYSRAFVQAVAAVTGFAHTTPSVDDDSIDLGLCARLQQNLPRSPRLEMQIKCTNGPQATGNAAGHSIAYPLKLKNYNDLRAQTLVPRILVVVVVPDDLGDWMQHDERALSLRRCGYWLSLRGQPATTNTTNVTVHLPRAQMFTVEHLQRMMERIDQRQPL